jgi:hypothetical protein
MKLALGLAGMMVLGLTGLDREVHAEEPRSTAVTAKGKAENHPTPVNSAKKDSQGKSESESPEVTRKRENLAMLAGLNESRRKAEDSTRTKEIKNRFEALKRKGKTVKSKPKGNEH